MPHDTSGTALLRWLVLSQLVLLAACASAPPRTAPLPESLYEQATVLGQPYLREWGDEVPDNTVEMLQASEEEIERLYGGIMGRQHTYLALSGGGENGAFTAGLLAGWTAAGDRPMFTYVTGISTGALIAPFAFLGPKYDHVIRDVYTNYAAEDLFADRKLRNIIRNDAVKDSQPMQALIERHMTPEVMAELAQAHASGRSVLLGTTNLDAARPVLWDVCRIAASGHPDALKLIQQVMLASASIPVGLPPVMIEVEANGQRYDEMHVDGGVTQQVFLYQLGVDWKRVEEQLKLTERPRVYVIRNAYIDPMWQAVDRKIAPIAGRTIGSLIRTQGVGDLYRLYLATQRDDLDFHLAYIPASFGESVEQRSGLAYMRQLYEFAYATAARGYPWEAQPPGLKIATVEEGTAE